MVPGAFEGEACVRHPPLLCWVTDVTCSGSLPSTICPPTTCPLVNSSALEANTSSPQCLDCHCCFFLFLKRCLSHRDKSVNMGIYMHGGKKNPTNIAFRSWLCDITTVLPSTDTASSAGLNIPLAAGRKHSESALKYHQSANQNHETKKCLSIFVYILSGANKLKC